MRAWAQAANREWLGPLRAHGGEARYRCGLSECWRKTGRALGLAVSWRLDSHRAKNPEDELFSLEEIKVSVFRNLKD